ncbi:MAG: hypothetical protein U5L45_09760 [Saprospiraceae bacterium]|nr:hypothetical protein [Saprospiraceae bacterium]
MVLFSGEARKKNHIPLVCSKASYGLNNYLNFIFSKIKIINNARHNS